MTRPDLKHVLDQLKVTLQLAEATPGCPPEILDALKGSEHVLNASMPQQSGREYAGSIRWTLEDDQCDPNGREIDLLVHYDWEDYSPGDMVTPSSGGCAQIADIEVIAVRYYDDRGEEIGLEQHHHDAAWQAVEQNRELLEETCTDAGHRDHAGRIDPIRFPEPTAEEETSPWRMAPSARQRIAKLRIRKQG